MPKPTPALTMKSAMQRSNFWLIALSLEEGVEVDDMGGRCSAREQTHANDDDNYDPCMIPSSSSLWIKERVGFVFKYVLQERSDELKWVFLEARIYLCRKSSHLWPAAYAVDQFIRKSVGSNMTPPSHTRKDID